MKKLLLLAIFAFCLSPFALNAQSRTNTLTRPCPAGTTPTRATVAIAVNGSITVTPCSGRTVVTNGVKVYRALLTQTSTNAPVATVLENSLGGTVVWARSNVGIYTATLTGAFPADKTFIISGPVFNPIGTFETLKVARTSANVLTLISLTTDIGTPTTDASDGVLLETAIEILVYP